MHIGLIGGIGPAATDLYYRGLIKAAAALGRDLEVTIVHADAPTLLGHLAEDNHAAQIDIYTRLTKRLAAAGAACVAVTSIAGHFCIDGFEDASPLPVANMMSILQADLQVRGLSRVGLLGTAPVMQTGNYGKLPSLETIAPSGDALLEVHEAYVTLATSGQSTPALQDVFFTQGKAMVEEHGAEAVLLAGTDLALSFDGEDPGFPVVDCAQVHISDLAARI